MTKPFRDPEFLRSLGVDPHYFGLGFIQLKIDETTRMHFWHPDLDGSDFEEEVHDHRYDFTSTVLVGELTNEVYQFVPDVSHRAKHEMAFVSCEPGHDGTNNSPPMGATGHLIHGGTYTMVAGSRYTFLNHVFHRVRAQRAVTLLERSPKISQYARVVRHKGAAVHCPFATPIAVPRLWEMIDDLLLSEAPGGARLERPGYHLHDIRKGILGDASKIREECDEFLDAVNQNSRIMALIELSDLYGAMQSYLERHHGVSVTMDDLADMNRITTRAFRNGRR